jgi:hypothetical protein
VTSEVDIGRQPRPTPTRDVDFRPTAAPGSDVGGKSTDRRDTLAVTNHRDAPRIDRMIEITLDIEHMFD